ncbi:molybdopterin-synthase adenylyltransferase MoeB [Candidatus Albibeggiatoa sp. nov. NOAA]|uniref:HesA/MoeB/ThiF family protein n=1 Tax=Candidatus Albibeggiatoa sp. nov. NOAA TaxID=3162724 RepID=UPI0032FF7DC6|nr:molybdopterin-synthase adenylyltransferase MoeB [Thiotrichaceae bacterium]
MNDEQLLRYSRQILLPQIDVTGQETLLNSKVLIVGVGGLGSPVAMYLAACGVGHLVLVDHDDVELSNLQRQIIHTTDSIGTPKVISAQQTLNALNPEVEITTYQNKIEDITQNLTDIDAIIDCSDNFTTRFVLNTFSQQHKMPLISGAALRFQGQLTSFLPAQANSPCYHCLYPDMETEQESCSESGVISPLVGVIGSLQAIETIKILLNIGTNLCGKLMLFDGFTMQWRTVTLAKDDQCPVCVNK